VVALPCETSLELYCFMVLCVAPLWLGGLRGKKSNPSVGWKIRVKSLRLARERSGGALSLKTPLISYGILF
jgi:hypothetical protein